ncbi:hypothetical protein RB213_016068, partial [Colletotrichum asianum]
MNEWQRHGVPEVQLTFHTGQLAPENMSNTGHEMHRSLPFMMRK